MFAPGHLGELTRIVPFEMVDAVLAQTRRGQQRVRLLPARVVVYLLLAAALFTGLGYPRVWHKLVAGLDGLRLTTPSGTALWHARARLGPQPLRALFDLLRGTTGSAFAAGARWHGLLVTAIDGTQLSVPDTAPNLARLGKHTSGGTGEGRTAGYPHIRLVALVACGSRTILDAVFGPAALGESQYALRLVRSLRADMIVLLDRGFRRNTLLRALTDSGAHWLSRLDTQRRTPVCARYPDGSFLSIIAGVRVRVIEATITVSTTTGVHTSVYRLATTLLDHHTHPAGQIIELYHERWEIETSYLELKSTMLGGAVLRSGTPAMIAQEIYALLTVYQILRIAIVDATDTVPDADPDRGGFTIALETAREQVIQAANVIAGTTIDLVGAIGRRILDNLLPARRPHVGPRVVKRPLSQYARATKKPRFTTSTYLATLVVTIHPPAIDTTQHALTS